MYRQKKHYFRVRFVINLFNITKMLALAFIQIYKENDRVISWDNGEIIIPIQTKIVILQKKNDENFLYKASKTKRED